MATRLTHSDEEMVYACPECDTAGDIRERTGTWNAWNCKGDERYACDNCTHRFEEPVEREAKPFVPDGESRAKCEETLLAMDPDDLPATGGAT